MPLTEEQAQAVADACDVILESVMRRLLGWPVKGRPGRRIDAELAKYDLHLSPDGELRSSR